MNKFILILLITLLTIISNSKTIITDGGSLTINMYTKEIHNIFETYKYIIYMPQNYTGQEEFSLIYMLSGNKMSPKILLQESSLHHFAEKYKFIIILPIITEYNQNIRKKIILESMKYVKENYLIKKQNNYTISMFENSELFNDPKINNLFNKFVFVASKQKEFDFSDKKSTAIITDNKNELINDGSIKVNLSGKLYSWPGGKKSIPKYNRKNEDNNFNLTKFIINFFF
ncbi:MAG: hypothetical protein M0R46_11820 [Candidatus Muirbacterium halophilum]|nr:hypothetical protein [Candidatus Muirbacterium halophilum]MCK9476602.1 hypothetical protein [Candidatus Muirbacterium halophilum]